MSNEKRCIASFECKRTVGATCRAKSLEILLGVSTEEFLLHKLEQENTVKRCKKDMDCGWQKISATCTYQSKILPSKPKNKKLVGNLPQSNGAINQFDPKNMKFLFSNSLRYMLSPDSYAYKPFNGVYRTMKFTGCCVDTTYNRHLILKKPTILIPLNKSDNIPKDILLLAVDKPKPMQTISSIVHNLHLNPTSSFFSMPNMSIEHAQYQMPNMSGLHITGGCSKNSRKDDLIPKIKSAEEKKRKYQAIAEKIETSMIFYSKKQQSSESVSKVFNSRSSKMTQCRPNKTLSIVKMKILANQNRNADASSLSNSLNSLVPAVLPAHLITKSLDERNNNNKTQKTTKRSMKNQFFIGDILKSLQNDKIPTEFSLNMKSKATDKKDPFLSLPKNLLPLIMGKRMSTIHF